ncbi:MAG TPA: DUF6159 family protein [Bryobacteraceae bacterium]|jgi:hypothetical protein
MQIGLAHDDSIVMEPTIAKSRSTELQPAGSWTRTLLLIRQSLGVLRCDKKLLFFPAAAGVSALCVSISFVRPLLDDGAINQYLEHGHIDRHTALWLFLWYYFHYFVILFFNSALTAATNRRMSGGDVSLRAGVLAAIDRLFPISMWTLVASTAGLGIRLFESRSKRLSSAMAALIGLTWTFATYFIVPVLMFEEAGIRPALKRSVQVTRQTWGEQLVNQVSLGFITFLFAIPGLILAAAGLFISHALLLPAFIYALILSVVLSAARAIFTVALYRYAVTGEIPHGFSTSVIAGPASARVPVLAH